MIRLAPGNCLGYTGHMQVIYPHRRQAGRTRSWRRFWQWAGVAALVFVGANVLLWAAYHNRTYPFTYLGGVRTGNTTYADVASKVRQVDAVKGSVQLTYQGRNASSKLSALGIQSNPQRTIDSLHASWFSLPLVSFFTRHYLAAPVAINNDTFAVGVKSLAPAFHVAPMDAHVTLSGQQFGVAGAKDGQELDQLKLHDTLLDALNHGQTTMTAPIFLVHPQHDKTAAEAEARKLQATLNTRVIISYGSQKQTPGSKDIAAWYSPAGATYQPNDFAIRTYVAQSGVKMGVHAANLDAAVAAVKGALAGGAAASVTLTPYSATKTYTYCVESRGADATAVSGLKAKLISTYADLRGWSLDGQVQFVYGAGNCDFTVWLSAADQMPSFGAICDSTWSCEVGNNVILNLNRWNDTSPAWQKAGKSLDDYRTLAINHETGHMLGFLDNPTCPGAGQPAPVMMQQSIDLKGCAFNIWPLQTELGTVRRSLGL